MRKKLPETRQRMDGFSARRHRWGRSSSTLRTGALRPWNLPGMAPHWRRSKTRPRRTLSHSSRPLNESSSPTSMAPTPILPPLPWTRRHPLSGPGVAGTAPDSLGQAISYGELARRVGNPKASRAVGQANAVNPIPLIVPCHRVIAADGSLGATVRAWTASAGCCAMKGRFERRV